MQVGGFLPHPTLNAIDLFQQFGFFVGAGILVPHLDARSVVIIPVAFVDGELLLVGNLAESSVVLDFHC